MKISNRIKQFGKDFFELMKSPRFFWGALLAFFILLLNVALIVWRIIPISSSRQFLPLHYNIYIGVDRFGSWYEIFIVPGIGLLIMIVNLFFQTFLHKENKFLATFFCVTTICLECLLLVATVLIVLLNISSYAA